MRKITAISQSKLYPATQRPQYVVLSQGAVRELSQVFRATVEEIMRDAGGREFSSEQMRGLMTIWENFRPKLSFTREGIRRAFLEMGQRMS